MGPGISRLIVLNVFPGDWGCPEKEQYRDTCPVVVNG